jgi:transcriptional regulator with XRE-family HTH domain
MDYEDFKNRLLANPEFAKEYARLDLYLEVSQMVLGARIARGMTQTKLAKLVGTHQPSIARIESGLQLPSLTFLEKIAKALKVKLIPPQFAAIETNSTEKRPKKLTYRVGVRQVALVRDKKR